MRRGMLETCGPAAKGVYLSGSSRTGSQARLARQRRVEVWVASRTRLAAKISDRIEPGGQQIPKLTAWPSLRPREPLARPVRADAGLAARSWIGAIKLCRRSRPTPSTPTQRPEALQALLSRPIAAPLGMHQNSRFWMSATSRTVIVPGVPNGGSARIIFVGVRHLASHHRSAVSRQDRPYHAGTGSGNVPPCRAALPAEGHAGARNRHARIYAPAAHRTRRRITGHAHPGRVTKFHESPRTREISRFSL